jgi:hypothetical protein
MRYPVYGAGAIGGTPGAHTVRGGESVLFVDKDVVGKQRTVGAFVNFSADYLESGLIHFAGRGAFWLGELDGSMTPRLHHLQRALGLRRRGSEVPLAFGTCTYGGDGAWVPFSARALRRGWRLGAVLGLGRLDQLAEHLVRLRADHHVASGNVGRHAGYACRPGEVELRFDPLAIATLRQRLAQLAAIQANGVSQAGEHVRGGDVRAIDKVGAVHTAAKRLAISLPVGPQRGLVGRHRVVPVGARPVRQPFAVGDLFEVRSRGCQPLRRPGNLLSFQGNTRVELERAVLHLQVIRLPQPVDPSLADVAPRSNEVAKHQQSDRHRSFECKSLPGDDDAIPYYRPDALFPQPINTPSPPSADATLIRHMSELFELGLRRA